MTHETSAPAPEYRRGPVLLRRDQIPATTSDQRLLSRGEGASWLHSDPWRVMRIQSEFVEGFGALAAEFGGTGFDWATTPETRAALWKMRHNAYRSCLALRPGATAVVTDV
ncbi:FAD-linked oxidase C-terminal domain-containing protein, partial [Streptomyces sp. SID12501]|uniref:FAD-linked oxidase C-terminal domain-containing protein n=1 Tax=Streptomyces sp. SID12501 TaxID=2706042 RepID=UPI0031BB0161